MDFKADEQKTFDGDKIMRFSLAPTVPLTLEWGRRWVEKFLSMCRFCRSSLVVGELALFWSWPSNGIVSISIFWPWEAQVSMSQPLMEG